MRIPFVRALLLAASVTFGAACGSSSSSAGPGNSDAGPGADAASGADTAIPTATGSATIDPSGGSIAIDGVGTVTFLPGTFATPTPVTVTTTADPATGVVFDETSAIFELVKRAPYELRINTGSATPTVAIQVALTVPSDLADPVRVLGELPEANDQDWSTQFEILDAVSAGGSLALSLPPEYVTDLLGADGTHEAVLVLAEASPDGATSGLSGSFHPLSAGGGGATCPVKKFGPPLKVLKVTSPFDASRALWVRPPGTAIACTSKGDCGATQGKVATDFDCQSNVCKNLYVGHLGTDYAAQNGDKLYAVGKGTVLRSYTSKDFGESVVIHLEGGGAVRYAHMKTRSVTAQQKVECGQVIGESDTTGLVTGPHLHFELAPGGGSKKVDANPCIDPNACAGCRFDVDYVGSAQHTVHQVFDETKNDGDEDVTITATGIRLSPLQTQTLQPVAGMVTYERTKVTHNGTTLCTVKTAGSTILPAVPESTVGSMTCTPAGALAPGGSNIGDPMLYYYNGNYAVPLHESSTDSCGQPYEEDAGVAWLMIPSIYSGPPGYSTMDFSSISGTYTFNSGGGNSAVETYEWNFAPAPMP